MIKTISQSNSVVKNVPRIPEKLIHRFPYTHYTLRALLHIFLLIFLPTVQSSRFSPCRSCRATQMTSKRSPLDLFHSKDDDLNADLTGNSRVSFIFLVATFTRPGCSFFNINCPNMDGFSIWKMVQTPWKSANLMATTN